MKTLFEVVKGRLGEVRWVYAQPDPATLLITRRGEAAATVTAYEYRENGEHALVLFARIAVEAAAASRAVLELAGRMGAGALALVGGHYVVRFTIPAAQIETARVAEIIDYVSRLARELATAFDAMRARPDPELFSHYGG